MGSNLLATKKFMGITEDKQYFEVNNRKVFYFTDPCHLEKARRNNMHAHQFVNKETEEFCNWDLIKAAYLSDCENDEKYLPRIKRDAIFLPQNRDKMKVSYATKVFSGSMCAAIRRMLDEGKISDEQDQAPYLLQHLRASDRVFDIFNSSYSDKKKSRAPFAASPEQMKALHEQEMLLTTLEVRTRVDSKLKIHEKRQSKQEQKVRTSFISCSLANIRALPVFFKYLQDKYNVTEVPMRRINQDPLENFFGQARSQQGGNEKPNGQQFQSSYKKLSINSVLKTSLNTNSEGDFPTLISCMTKPPVPDDPPIDEFVPFLPDEEFFQRLRKYREDPSSPNMFLSGFFVKKYLKKHDCEACKTHLVSEEKDSSIMIKEQECQMEYISPTPAFAKYLKTLFLCLKDYLATYLLESHVVKQLTSVLIKVPCPIQPDCDEFPLMLEWLIHYFVQTRLYLQFKEWRSYVKKGTTTFLDVRKLNEEWIDMIDDDEDFGEEDIVDDWQANLDRDVSTLDADEGRLYQHHLFSDSEDEEDDMI